MEVGVISQHALGLGSREQVLIGRQQNEARETLTEQRVFQEERTGKMKGVIAAQLLTTGQSYRIGYHALVYVHQPVLVSPIAL